MMMVANHTGLHRRVTVSDRGGNKRVGRRTRKHALEGERDGEGGHQRLVSGGVEDRAEHGAHVEPPCQEPVDLLLSTRHEARAYNSRRMTYDI